MKVIVKKNSPSLKNFMNKGGKFSTWRHEHTNYEFSYKALTAKFGRDSKEYFSMVEEFAAEVIGTLNNEAHKAAVAAWAAGKAE
jgi:hypothetical protein